MVLKRKYSGANSKVAKKARYASKKASPYFDRKSTRAEQKWLTQNVDRLEISQTPVILLVNEVAAGTDNTNRIGREISMRSIQYDFCVQNNVTALGNASNFENGTDAYRVALVYDKASNGVAPLYTDIWEAGGAPASTDWSVKRNLDNIDRFTVLADEKGFICEADNAKMLSRYLKIELSTRYDSTAADQAAITTGGLYLVMISQTGFIAGQATMVIGSVRVQFTDV